MTKNILLIIATITVIILSFSSCDKCTTCTKSGGSSVTLCENDYTTTKGYGVAIQTYSDQGYTCM